MRMDENKNNGRDTEITTITPSEYGEAPGAGVETGKPVQPIAEGTGPLARENGKADYPKPAWQQDNRPEETAVQPSPSPSTNGDTSDDVDKELRGALIPIDQQIDALKKKRAEYDRYNETDEDRKKREKREKSSRLVSAIGDTLNALSGMYFASRYAPAVKTPRTYDKEVERQDKLKAEREAGKDAYLKYTLKMAELEGDKDKILRDIRAQAAKARIDASRNEREQQEHDWLGQRQPEIIRKATADADAAESIAKTRAAEAANAEGYYKGRNDLQDAKIHSTLTRGSGGGSGGKGGKPYGTFLGKSYATKADYEAAVVGYAKKNGIPLQYERETIDDITDKKTKTKTLRTIASLRTDAEAHYARTHQQKSRDNTPPSRRNNNDNTPPSRRKNN